MRKAGNSNTNNLMIGRYDLSSSDSPSFNGYSSSQHLADIAARVIREFQADDDNDAVSHDRDNNSYDHHHHHHRDFYFSHNDHDDAAALQRVREDEYDDDDDEHDEGCGGGEVEEERGGGRIFKGKSAAVMELQAEEVKGGGGGSEFEFRNQIGAARDEEEKEKAGSDDDNEEEGGSDSESDFEFAVPFTEDATSSPISADEIFQNGQIRPQFPLFNTDLVYADFDWRFHRSPVASVSEKGNSTATRPPHPSNSSSDAAAATAPIRVPLRKLLIEHRGEPTTTASAAAPGSCSSSEADELEGVEPGTYCVWKPGGREEMSRKSNSTGTGRSSKRWRLLQLINRSHSDGSRDSSFVFVPAAAAAHKNNNKMKMQQQIRRSAESRSSPQAQDKGKKAKAKGTDGVGKGKEVGAREGQGDMKKKKKASSSSYLPYRKDLVGLFANVNAVSRTVQPF